jgi:outer membrane receptor protein involved in Fe transport
VTNLRLSWRPTPMLELVARVNNVFDKQYASYGAIGETVFDAQGNYTGIETDALFIAPGTPRSVFVGLRLSF